jgi:predicted nucleotidyltransferase
MAGTTIGTKLINAQFHNRDWESVFGSWGAAPSPTEQTKCENTERAIRKATGASTKLNSKNVEIFAQGSYADRTNVRQDSDVDICALCTDTFFPDYRMSQGLSDSFFGFGDSQYRYADFKNDVEAALRSYFGTGSVTRGTKAFDIHENTYRLDADVVPCFEHRRFIGTPQSNSYISGTQFLPIMAEASSTGPVKTIKMALTRTTPPNAASKPSSAF